MRSNLRILLIVVAIFLLIIVFRLIANRKLPIKYSLFWILASTILFLVGAFPNFIGLFTKIIGFETTSNLVVGTICGILLVITLILTLIISEQRKKIIMLIQEVSIIEKEIKK